MVEAIDTPDGPLQIAVAGQSVVIRLNTDIDVSRGDILAATDAPPAPLRELTATVCWLAERELNVGARVLVQHGTALTKAIVRSIDGALDLTSRSAPSAAVDRPSTSLTLNDIGRVRLALATPLADRHLPRAPDHRRLHHRGRSRRLDPGCRHGRAARPFSAHRRRSTASSTARSHRPRPCEHSGRGAVMTAPSLVLLGYGSTRPARRRRSATRSVPGSSSIRPELDVHVAFLDHCPPTGLQVVNKLVRRGVTEVVFVPLLLSDAFHAQVEVPALIAQVQAAHPDLQVIASRPDRPGGARCCP